MSPLSLVLFCAAAGALPQQGVRPSSPQRSGLSGLDLWNTGLDALAAGSAVGGILPVLVREGHQEVDLNGDGDRGDRVAFALDLASRSALNTGYAAETVACCGSVLVLQVLEASQKQDLNGDGDRVDRLAVVYDLRSHAARVLFAADQSYGEQDCVIFVRPTSEAIAYDARSGRLRALGPAQDVFALVGRQVLVRLAESSRDLNGDGDRGDEVWQIYEVDTDSFTNLGVAGTPAVLQGHELLVSVGEAAQRRDLDGDGDQGDHVLHSCDLTSGAVRNEGLALASPAFLRSSSDEPEPWAGLWLDEDGRRDMDGDGGVRSTVLHVRDPHGAITNLGRLRLLEPQLAGHALTGRVDESVLAADLNDDDDLLDSAVFVIDLVTRRKSLFPASTTRLTPSLLALAVSESQSGDENGDGDSEDLILQVHDLARGTTDQTGETVAARFDHGYYVSLEARGNLVAILSAYGATERSQAYLYYDDPGRGAGGRLVETGVSALLTPSLADPWALWTTVEAYEQEDLNHDGDTSDYLSFAYHAPSDTLFDLWPGRGSFALGPLVLWLVEAESSDLNGDGDTEDEVLHVVMGP